MTQPNRFGTRWLPRALAILLAVSALLVGAATAAQAHGILIGTSPKDGTVTAEVPAQVTLTFNEPALAVGTILIVTGPAGQVQSGAAVLVDSKVSEHLRPGSPAGTYSVIWRVTSADGHPVSGKFSFTARSPSPGQQAAASPTAASSTSTVNTGSSSPTRWWVLAAGVIGLLLAGFVITRRPRAAPASEQDPNS